MTPPDRSQDTSPAVPGRTHSPAVVRLEDVAHEYATGDRGQSVIALRGVSLSAREGEIVGLEGPSGSGKSTILHAITGLLVPTDGNVTLRGTELTAATERERTRLRRRHVGIVFQRFHLLPSLSARANVALPLVQAGLGKSRRRERSVRLLEAVGLGDRITHLPGELSGGERQRVAIARALATDPDVLVADEPTGELDTATGRTVLELLTDVGRDRAVVVASHDDATLSVADRVISLRDGRVIEGG